MIPKEWSLCNVDDICDSVNVGIVIKPTQYYVESLHGVKAFRSANVREGKINNNDWVYISHEGDEKNKKSRLREGDILVVRTGYPGTACVVTKEFENSNAIDIVIARPNKNKVIPYYLCTFTNSEYGKSQVLNLQGGMAQKHLNVGEYKCMKILLPPFSEQTKIANILSTWDKAIETVEKLIENSHAQKKALMQQLLTGKKRLPGFKDKWREISIGKMGNIVSGGTPASDNQSYWDKGVAWATPTDITALKSRFIDKTKRTISPEGVKNSSAQLLPPGSLLVCTRATIGYLAIASDEITTNQGFKSLIPNEAFDSDFIYYLFKYYKNEFIRHACGSTFLEISKKDFSKLTFHIPLIEEQKAIAEILNNAGNDLWKLDAYRNHLANEKKCLMQQLLTGKRRVKPDRNDD